MMPYQFGSPSPASHHCPSGYRRSHYYPHLVRSRSAPSSSLLLGCCGLVFLLLLLLLPHPQQPQQESTIITTTTTGARHRRIFFIEGFPLTPPVTRVAPCRPVIVTSSSVSPVLAAALAAAPVPVPGETVGWVSAPSWCNSRGRRSCRHIATTTTTTILRNQKTDETEGEESAAPAESTALESSSSSSSWLWTLVVPLLFVYVSNQWSRSSIYYLVDFSDTALATAAAAAGGAGVAGAASSSSELAAFRAMNLALDFDQTQYGILASVAFTALFGVASLGAGIASDRWDRKVLTIGSSAGWALASFGTAVATSYPEVVGWRILMGLCCAFTTPTAYTLINERVPTANKSFATSLYGTGVAFGGALASLSILLDTDYGWKNTMLIISVVGFLSSFLSLLLLPPDDTAAAKRKDEDPPERIGPKSTPRSTLPTDDDTSTSTTTNTNTIWQDVVVAVTSNARTKWIYLGSFLRFSSGLCIGVWSAPYFRQAFPDNAQQYAIAQAVITAVGGSVSGLLGGTFADQLAASASKSTTEDNNDRDSETETETNTKLVFGMIDTTGIQEPRLIVPVIGSLLAVPCWYSAMHTTQDFNLAMVYLATEYLVAECWFGPTISSLLTTVEPKVTGTAQGLFTLTGAVANLSPSLLGFLYGQASGASIATGGGTSSTEDLVNLLSNGVCFGYISCAVCFAIAAQSSSASPSISSTSSNNNSNKVT